jgi:hypothetical protein
VDTAARQYVETRLAGAGVALEPAVVTNHPGAFDTATVVLRATDGPSGVVQLRVDGGEREWEVTGAFVDGIALDAATYAQGQAHVQGANRSGLPARLVRRSLDGTTIDEQPLDGEVFDLSIPTTESVLLSIVLERDTAVAGFAEVRVDVPVAEAIWPAQPTDEDPEALATRFATEELTSRAQLDATSIRDDGATITFKLFGPDLSEWSGVIVELEPIDGHWFVTQAYSRDITVTAEADPAGSELTYTISSPDSTVAYVAARPPGSGPADALDGTSPVAMEDGETFGTVSLSSPPQVLIVLARSSEVGDRYWLQRITA